jgi:hypothetical protein
MNGAKENKKLKYLPDPDPDPGYNKNVVIILINKVNVTPIL